MARRQKTEVRQRQIVEAVMHLLGEMPLSELSTRRIAAHLDLTQPALFRHFPSREALLAAAVEAARGDLSAAVSPLLERTSEPVEAIRVVVRVLLEHVATNPGLPRLLFWDELPPQGPLARALQGLMSAQTRVLAELVRAGQRTGALRASLEPARAAALLVGSIQGTILQWRRGQTWAADLPTQADAILSLWLDGALARPGEALAPPPPETAAATPEPTVGLLELDVRPLVAQGEEPLETILAAIARAGRDGVLVLHAPFRPGPLLSLVACRGWSAQAHEVGDAHWTVEMTGPEAPPIADLRDLPAPEPLEAALVAAAGLSPGERWFGRTPRVPRLLLQRLAERGLHQVVVAAPDGSALVMVEAPP